MNVKSTLTAIRANDLSWAWVDLERWNPSHATAAWVPVAPGVVTTLLRAESASRGGLPVRREHAMSEGDEGALVADLVLDPTRELPLVVISHSREEEGGVAAADARAREIARRLAGIAGVYVLGEGAVTSFSRAMYEAVGEGMDVHSGAVRTYLPGAGSDSDYPGRHRYVAFHRLHARRVDLAAPDRRTRAVASGCRDSTACDLACLRAFVGCRWRCRGLRRVALRGRRGDERAHEPGQNARATTGVRARRRDRPRSPGR